MINPLLPDPAMLLWLIPLIIWDLAWRGVAMWKAGRNNQLAWFVCLLLFNTAGILPIIYIVWFQKGAAKPKKAAKKKQ